MCHGNSQITRLATAIAFGIMVGMFASPRLATAQVKAFPQAEGFGASASGGRGGTVYHVTSLADTNTVGTLRYGLTSLPAGTPVTIVFDVGGWIDLTGDLGLTRNNVTIAGQTAPGGGIGVTTHKFSVGGQNIVVRHMRFRHGRYTNSEQDDSINVSSTANDVIFDHISADVGRDENFSVQGRQLTLQWSSVSYGLEGHSAGSLIEQAFELTFHHNVYAYNNTRNPKARVNNTIDWINNVVFNYKDGGFIAGDSNTTTFFWTANVDGNYYITGPDAVDTDMIVLGRDWNYGLYFGTNAYDGDGDGAHDGVLYAGTGSPAGLESIVSGTYTWSPTPYPVEDTIWKDADPQAAYERVLAEFGPTPSHRDEFNALVASNIVNRSFGRIMDQNTLPLGNNGYGTLIGGTAPTDADGDGIADEWESRHGLSTAAASNNGDFDSDGYTNIEEYLNDLAAFPATGPLEFDGSGRYADWNNWTRRWEPSRVDDVHVNVGTATVDAVGQRAGTLRIGATAGSDGTLNIDSGWLEVTDEVVIGADPAATAVLNLTGGMLSTPVLNKGAGGSFNFTGGTLHSDTVNFDLATGGGTLSPGHSIGQTHVVGDLALNSGSLAIELASAALADSLVVDGTATLGGALDVSLLGSFTPTAGDHWQIIDADDVSGTFDTLTSGYSLQKLGNDVVLYFGPAPVELAGDFNADGTVDGADYTVWRDSLNSHTPFFNETASLGVVDGDDFDAWKANFGASGGGSVGASPSQNGVPEPASWVLGLLSLLWPTVGLRRAWLAG